MKIARRILWLLFLFALITFAVAWAYYGAVTKNAILSPEKLRLNERSVVVYDGKNEPIGNVSTFWKQTVSAQDIPSHTKAAFIDTEDKRFLKHNGFDYKRIVKAALNNFRTHSFKEGASTISQQLIKNTHLTHEKTLKRKLQEWKLTKQLEKNYTKEEILEKYLNSIYFGHSCFGITAASEFYFGKSVNELTLADSVILAGLIKSPNHYSPFKNPENAQKRKGIVLSAMLQNGSITQEEKEQALKEPLPQPNTTQNQGFLHFVFDEFSEIAERNHLKIGGKIEIRTQLDSILQNEIERVAQEISDCDKTIFICDNQTHSFKGAYSTLGNIPRLPGSLIKPLLVYAPAIEENILSPATPILDEKIRYGEYSPENYNHEYHGYVSARKCLAKSLNIPAVKTLSALGTQKGIEYLEKLGLKVDQEDASLALALGGMKRGFTLKDLSSAYITLANSGIYTPCSFITEIRINGIAVYTKETRKNRAFSEESAYLTTDMLKTAATSGTAKKLRALPFEIAAKTGTVGTDQGNTDAYTVAYTTKDCVSIWLGNADNTEIPHTGGGLPCNLANTLHSFLYEQYNQQSVSISPFSKPKEVVCVALDKSAYCDTHTLLLADELSPPNQQIYEWFKTSAIPLNKSTSFTLPNIVAPQIKLVENKVIITFDCQPSYYTYKIERSDYVTHSTLYEGKLLQTFEDSAIEADKQYVYTVTPIYKDRIGTPVVLPSISTNTGNEPNWQDNAMLDKNWWDE